MKRKQQPEEKDLAVDSGNDSTSNQDNDDENEQLDSVNKVYENDNNDDGSNSDNNDDKNLNEKQTKLAYAMSRILGLPTTSTSLPEQSFDLQTTLQSKSNKKSAKKEKPILSKQKSIEAAINDAKLEEKAKKLLSREKKLKTVDFARVKPDDIMASNDVEKRLKKVATRGVVKLFNAIRVAQKSVESVKADGVLKNQSKLPSLTQAGFMQMIKDPILQTASSSSAPVKSDSVTTSKNSESKKNNKKGGDKASAGSSNSIVPWIDDKFMMKDTPAEKPSWDMDSD